MSDLVHNNPPSAAVSFYSAVTAQKIVTYAIVVAGMEDAGMRGWMRLILSFASFVTIGKDCSEWPALSFQASYRPAKAKVWIGFIVPVDQQLDRVLSLNKIRGVYGRFLLRQDRFPGGLGVVSPRSL